MIETRPHADALFPPPEVRTPAIELPPEVNEAIRSITPLQGNQEFVKTHDELRVIAGEFSASHPSRQEVLAQRACHLLEKEAALIEERIAKMPEGDIRAQWILRLGKVTLAADTLENAVPEITRMADAVFAQKIPQARVDIRILKEEKKRTEGRDSALLRVDEISALIAALENEREGLIKFVRGRGNRISTATTVEAPPRAE